MTDVLTPEQRRRNMSRIRSSGTKPEVRVRRALHATGLRFRLHHKGLPGKPDLVLSRHRAVVLVHGCFWHAHGCSMSRVPETRVNYWREKLERNARRDGEVMRMLRTAGWRVLVIWECALRGPGRRLERETIGRAVDFIRESKVGLLHIAGINAPAESPSE